MTDISANRMMNSDPSRLHAGKLNKKMIGTMMLYFYDPKWKEELPYYDRFPLVFAIETYNDGFLGLNLHYLPPRQRAILYDFILQAIDKGGKNGNEALTYQSIKAIANTGIYKPCVKRYLYSHLRSKIQKIPRDEWDHTLMLPIEKFEKASLQKVFNESMRKIRP